MMEETKGLREVFAGVNTALREFWDVVDALPDDAAPDEVKEALMDPADRVFLARDAAMTAAGLDDTAIDRLTQKVQMVRDCLDKKGVEMNLAPQRKSTGGMTYRPLLVKRFDG